jgi:hypothetical protein
MNELPLQRKRVFLQAKVLGITKSYLSELNLACE